MKKKIIVILMFYGSQVYAPGFEIEDEKMRLLDDDRLDSGGLRDESGLQGRHRLNDFYNPDDIFKRISRFNFYNAGTEVRNELDQELQETGIYRVQDYDADLKNTISSKAAEIIREWVQKKQIRLAEDRNAKTSFGSSKIRAVNEIMARMEERVTNSAEYLVDNPTIRKQVKNQLDKAHSIAREIQNLLRDPKGKSFFGKRSVQNQKDVAAKEEKLFEVEAQLNKFLEEAQMQREGEIELLYQQARKKYPPHFVYKQINETSSEVTQMR